MGSRTTIGTALERLFRATHGNLAALSYGRFADAFRVAGESLLTIAGPPILAAAGAGAIAGLVQSGLRLNTDALGFTLSRMHPGNRIKDLFSPKRAIVELLLSGLRIGVIGYVAYRISSVEFVDLLTLGRVPLEISADSIVHSVVRVVLGATLALGVIAAVDYAQSRFRLSKEMMMTRQELMEDQRQQEGDPKLKGRMKARARALAKKRALQNVKRADVIVTNPTHIAVALRYNDRDPAPVVVAKGHDDIALSIRREARTWGIPILENRSLARALDAEVPVGHTIPAAHFAAVARVLAYVYRLRGRKRRGTQHA
jgi:flagellar biosynthetic protein FlhB